MKTLIRGGTVVACTDDAHTVIENGMVVFEGNDILHVGETYTEQADSTIDASGKLVIPGLINTHAHITDTAYTGELLVDHGHHDWRDVLYKYLPAVRGAISAEDEFIASECAFAELMLSGTTTAVELGFDYEMMEGGDIAHTAHIADIAGNIGLRCYLAPRYRSLHWGLGDDGKPWYKPYPNRGLSRFEAECAFAELMLSGTTTAVELGFDFEMMEGGDIAHTAHIAGIAGNIGLRCYLAPRYRSLHWGLGDDGKPWYKPYPNRGLSRFEDCFGFCRDFDGRFDGRIRTMLAPGQVDTCDPEILKITREAADEIGVVIQLHAGQSSQEFREIGRRHGQTTVEYISSTGLLGPDLIIGHGMFLSEDGDVDHCEPGDLRALRETGTSIAHLPWIQVRQGRFMRSFAKYRHAGINMCLGTDTFPFDMIHEMQWAAVLCKIAEQDPKAGSAREIFHSATIGGARALNRDDLGRLAPGCKADIVIVDLDKPHALPLRDPFKFMVYSASAADVDTVIIDGRTVVSQGKPLFCDLPTALGKLREAITRVHERVGAQ